MGSGSSKPATTALPTPQDIKFTPDYSAATVGISELQRQLASAQQTAQQQAALAVKAVSDPLTQSVSTWKRVAFWGMILVAVGFGLLFLADYINIKLYGKELSGFGWLEAPQSSPETPGYEKLYISYAHYGPDNSTNYKDVTQYITSMIVGETTLPAFTVSYQNVGLSSDPYPGKASNLYIQYYVGTQSYIDATYIHGSTTDQLPVTAKVSPKIPASGKAPVSSQAPGFASRLYNSIFGDSSPNLAPSYHDASSSVTVPGKNAPLSSQNEGGYGMQWWMYVKDWNYGYGKKKSIVKRSDTTNGAVMNPHISLHPTDNTLQVSVSVFPATEGGAAKSAPAPAGHSGSTDDVFVCEVPNIPLQTWFAVSVTVFGRNLDVYIDGKLVKSCFLSGVPKPAVGDISLTPDGGFSGRICDFYHYPRMLTPADTATFYNSGTSCRSKTEPSTASKATGYSVKFGVYDSLGKNINEYTF